MGEKVAMAKRECVLKREKGYLLAGTYTTADAPGCTKDTVCGKGVYCYSYNTETGQVGEMTDLMEMENPSYLTVNRAGNLVLAVNEKMEASVIHLCTQKEGKLRVLDSLSAKGAAACHIAYEENQGLLATANYMSGSMGIALVRQKEKLERQFEICYQGKGSNPERQEMSHVHSCLFYKHFLLVADLGLDQIHVYQIVDGTIDYLEEINTRPGSGPRHMAVYEEDSNAWLYVVNELSCDVSVYEFRAGDFQEIQREPLFEGQWKDGNLAADIHITKNGILYASLRGADKIVWFQIRHGNLTKLGSMDSGGEGPRSFCFDWEERHLIVANQLSSNLAIYPMEQGIVNTENAQYFSVPVPVKVLTIPES